MIRKDQQDTISNGNMFDTFLCSRCMRNIPIFNQVVHEIQCEKGYGVEIPQQQKKQSGDSKNNPVCIESEEDVEEEDDQSESMLIEDDDDYEEVKEDYNNNNEEEIEIEEIVDFTQLGKNASNDIKRGNNLTMPIAQVDLTDEGPDLIMMNPNHTINRLKKKSNPQPQQSQSRKTSYNVSSGETECKYCGSIVELLKLKEHLNIECMNQRIPCEFCDIPIHTTYYMQHSKECDKNPNQKKKKDNHNKPSHHKKSGGSQTSAAAAGDQFLMICDNCDNSVPYQSYLKHQQTCNNRGNAPKNAFKRMNNYKNNKYHKPKEDVVFVECNVCGDTIDAKRLYKHEKRHARGELGSLARHTSLPTSSYANHINDNGEEIIVEHNAIVRVKRHVIPGMDNSLMVVVENISRNHNNNMNNLIPNMVFGNNSNRNDSTTGGLDKELIATFCTMEYDEDKSTTLDEECRRCIICLGDFQHDEMIRFLPCMHRFHLVCIDPWLHEHPTCPNCKKNFKGINKPT